MKLRRAARVILVGAPGVGKGTQSERLLSRFPQLQSISSGDLLRHNVKQKTPLGKSFLNASGSSKPSVGAFGGLSARAGVGGVERRWKAHDVC